MLSKILISLTSFLMFIHMQAQSAHLNPGDIAITAFQSDNNEELKKAALYFLEKMKHHLGDKSIMKLVLEGDTADSIIKTARSEHADIIVVGSHSKKWLENIVMGSVTERVLHKTTIPIFIVPTKMHEQ